MRTEYIIHRHRRRKETFDPYDGFARKYPKTATTKQSDYWSNGTTSLLTMTTPSATNSTTLLEETKPLFLTTSSSSANSTTTTRTTSTASSLVKNSIVSGSIAGMTSCILFHPLDVIRTKMQSSTMISSSSSSTVSAIQNGPLSIMSQTIRQGGVRALYTGLSLPLAAQAIYKATIFTSNQLVQGILKDYHINEQRKLGNFTQTYELSYIDHFLCGSFSGAINAFLFVAPVEYVRNQLIMSKLPNSHSTSSKNIPLLNSSNNINGPLQVIQRTLQTTGSLSGLWRGAGITVMRDSIGCGSFFFMFQLGQTYILPSILPIHTSSDSIPLVHKVGSGFLAGFGYWFASLPLDAIKTLIQTNQAKSANEVISTLIRTHGGIVPGISQLYKGWQVAFGRGSPSAAVTITTYSLIFHTLQQQQQPH